jgi:hypothetical protein
VNRDPQGTIRRFDEIRLQLNDLPQYGHAALQVKGTQPPSNDSLSTRRKDDLEYSHDGNDTRDQDERQFRRLGNCKCCADGACHRDDGTGSLRNPLSLPKA